MAVDVTDSRVGFCRVADDLCGGGVASDNDGDGFDGGGGDSVATAGEMAVVTSRLTTIDDGDSDGAQGDSDCDNKPPAKQPHVGTDP